MDIKIFIDEQCGYNFWTKIDKYENGIKESHNNKNKQKLIIVFSNNFQYVKEISRIYPKPNVVINITENLSEYHVSNSLKYVADICYFGTDVKTVMDRVVKTYNRLAIKKG